MHKGKHLLVDCRNVDREVCLDDQHMLAVIARAATRAGATVISQVRYKFGADSPPGFAAVVLLDESHCSVHTYADLGLMAMDCFTCGTTDPRDVLRYIREEVDLGDVIVQEADRFGMPDESDALCAVASTASVAGCSLSDRNGYHAEIQEALE